MASDSPSAAVLALLVCGVFAGCGSDEDQAASQTTDGGATGSSAGEASTGTPMEESTGSEGQTESSSGGTPTSSSSGGQACTLLDESIDIARLDALGPEDDFADVPCDVTGDGFLCTFDKDPELVDVDAVLEGFASVPWEPGQSVLIGGFGPLGSSYEASLAVESTNGGLLALIVWNRSEADIEARTFCGHA